MKIDFVEVAGFRGIRDASRFAFADGFVVLAGRNGAGKSTVIDAIDFALSGTINRFAVKDAKGGGLDEHIWWRGEGAPAAHYVTVGFVDADGSAFAVRRDRDHGVSPPSDEILRRLCHGGSTVPAMETLIQTSIIRDELIAALSLDLPEQARFQAVRSAIGAIAGPDYSKRTTAVLHAATVLKEEQEKEIERIQSELGRTLSALTEARSATEKSADLASAIRTIASVQPLAERADNTEEVRKWVASRRKALGEVDSARVRSEKILPQVQDIQSGRGIEELTSAVAAEASALKSREDAVAQLQAADGIAATEREADEYAAHLAALVEHGVGVGLFDGHCPLCDAERTTDQFLAGVHKARARLAGRDERLRSVLAVVESAKAALERAENTARASSSRVDALRVSRAATEEQAAAIQVIYRESGFDVGIEEPETVQRLVLAAQEEVAAVERALFVLEASSSIDRLKTLETRVSMLKEQADKEAAKLSDLEKAAESARQIDATAKTVANQMLEEQFDTVMPLLKELYRRLRPHPNWLEIEADFGGRVRASLNFVVGRAGNPQFLFSSGQRRAAGLAFLLAIHLSRSWCRWNSLVLDDPVQHIDDYRALNLAEVLSSVRRMGRQVVVAVEDPALADVLCRRLRSASGEAGRRIDLRISSTGTTEIAEILDIAPLPSTVLQEAKAS